MAESKRTFQAAKIDRDLDERLIQPGSYRDAVNVSVDFSENANVGSLENVKGNEILANQNILGLSSSSNPNAVVIGSYAHPEENKIYYFVTGDKTDGIFEYDGDANTVKPIILDSSSEPIAFKSTFVFSNAGVTATVSQSGTIRVTASLGSASAITENFDANTTGSAISQKIDVAVIVPAGYANSNETIVGQVTASQASQTAPSSVETLAATNKTSNSGTIHGKLGRDDINVTAVGFYWGYNTAGTALTLSELENGGSGITRNTVNISSFENSFSTDISGLPVEKKISYAAFATNTTGTGEGPVKTFDTVEAPAYNKLPDNKIFIFPTSGDSFASNYYYPGYGEFEKADGSFYLATAASHSSGLYTNYGSLSTGVTLSNTGPATLTYTNLNTQWSKTSSRKTSPSTSGVYTITASKSGFTSNTTQIVKGSPSGTRYKSTFTLNFAKTGSGTVPFVAVFDPSNPSSVHWNDGTIAPTAVFSIGPFEQSQKGVIMIPLSTDNTAAHAGGGTTADWTGTFEPANLDVSITGKTEGTHYDYYIATQAMSIWGSGALDNRIPAVIIEADPYTLNSGTANVTHTLNITYNY